MRSRIGTVLAISILAIVASTNASATLHLSCVTSTSTCGTQTFGGTDIIATNTNNPIFGIHSSPTSSYGANATLTIAILVPSQSPTLNFTVNWGSSSAPAVLASGTPWTSGSLIPYLGLPQANGGGPNNPFNAYITPAGSVNPGTTGFSVYLATFPGAFTLSNTASSNPLLSFTQALGSQFPAGTIITAFVMQPVTVCTGHGKHQTCTTTMTVVDTTANSSALLLTPTPEPGSMVLLGSGLLMFGGVLRRRLRKEKEEAA